MAVDAGLALLNRYGFNLVQRPEVRLWPLDVLGRDDVLERIGPLPALFESPAPLPPPLGPAPAEMFKGQTTELIQVAVAERILVRILNGLGSDIQRLRLNGPADAIKFVRFSFEDVLLVSVAPQPLAAYLSAGEPAAGPGRVRYFDNPEANVYVIAGAMHAFDVHVLPADENGAPADIDLAALSDLLRGSIRVSRYGEGVRLSGREPATAAFMCYRVTRTGGTWELDSAPALIAAGTRVMVRHGVPPPGSS